jgi:ferrochelatase
MANLEVRVNKPGVLLLNFGGPARPEELEPFLRELFTDVLPFPGWLKWLAVPWIASSRAKKVRTNYETIGWSPLVETTGQQLDALAAALDGVPTAMGMQFSEPTIEQALLSLADQGADHIVAIGLYPHYSIATADSTYAMVAAARRRLDLGHIPLHFVNGFHDHPIYIDALADTIKTGIEQTPGTGPVAVLFSPHGLPMSIVNKGDPYPDHVRTSAELAMAALRWEEPWHLGWQSRVGPVKWLAPSTETRLTELGTAKTERVCVVPLSFVGEHIETLHEIDIEYAEHAHEAGVVHFGRAPALGLHPGFIACLADLATTAISDFGNMRCPRCLVRAPRPETCAECGYPIPGWLTDAA